jgi:hypothetical protein
MNNKKCGDDQIHNPQMAAQPRLAVDGATRRR